jgi:uncharacterized integral membrane protein
MTTTTMTEPTTGAPVMSTKDWMITLLISSIPLVGFVMLFVWAFGSNENPNRANWAKAALIWMVIIFGLLFLVWGSLIALFVGAASSGGDF